MYTPQHYMTYALKLAKHGIGTVSPNPMVGCVIVNADGNIIGEGYHQRAGEAHAEILAIKAAKAPTTGATLYCTLEPCCHVGKTPPCTDAIIQAGIHKVYVACLDPNPLVAGKGVEKLRAAGIDVEVGLEEAAAKELNDIFFHFITHKRPFVIAKWAMSLDGKTVTHQHDERKISNATSHQHVHQTRKMVDAILVGANTIRQDNPLLTARDQQNQSKQPLRVILSSKGCLPFSANVFSRNLPGKTLIVTTSDVDQHWYQQAQEKHIDTVIVKKSANDQICLHALLDELGKREISSLLVEGGRTVLDNFFKEQLVNQVDVYLAPNIIGTLDKKFKINQISHQQLDGDHYFTAKLMGKNYV